MPRRFTTAISMYVLTASAIPHRSHGLGGERERERLLFWRSRSLRLLLDWRRRSWKLLRKLLDSRRRVGLVEDGRGGSPTSACGGDGSGRDGGGSELGGEYDAKGSSSSSSVGSIRNSVVERRDLARDRDGRGCGCSIVSVRLEL